jgi:LysM repeat protein
MSRYPLARASVLALMAILTLGGGLASSTSLPATIVELLKNGSFEQGFTAVPGCGMVGIYWGCFQNGGNAEYGFFDDQWGPVVFDGRHSQLIEINTKRVGGDPDRYAGIYQTVDVIPGATYRFTIRGMIRADDQEGDPWRYRVQVAFDHSGGSNWTAVSDWIELPWDTYYPRTAPGGFSEYTTTVTARGSRLTVFVRVWKKWGDWYREVDVNVDAISLIGPAPAAVSVNFPVPPPPVVIPSPLSVPAPLVTAPAPICAGPNLLRNGDFEQGFYRWGVAYYWGWFHNGGRANYGFYDDQWSKVVYNGQHSQLIEINTYEMAATDADRYAGIYQIVDGLQPGALYELTIAGMMREEAAHPEEDPYRYRVQWGYAPYGGLDWTLVANWQELPWDLIYIRTDPGSFLTYRTTFIAPSSRVTIFVRIWKKWATTGRELDVNLDAIALRACQPPTAPLPTADPLVHVVKPGEYLAAIAARYGTTVRAISRANGLRNPNRIYPGQRLVIPGALPEASAVVAPPPPMPPLPNPDDRKTIYIVRPGDTLYAIAARFKTTPYAIGQANSLRNLNWIYVGQRLIIPTT